MTLLVVDEWTPLELFAALRERLLQRGHAVQAVATSQRIAAQLEGAVDVLAAAPGAATWSDTRLEQTVRVMRAAGTGEAGARDLLGRWLQTFRALLDARDVVAVVTWGEHRAAVAAALAAARERGAATWMCEQGLFRPETVTMDARGLHAHSSVPRDPAFFARWPTDATRLDPFLRRFAADAGHRDSPYPFHHPAGRLRAAGRHLLRGRGPLVQRLHDVAAPAPRIPPRFVLLPLQREGDAQLVLNGRDVGQDALVAAAADAARRAGLPLLVRTHPATPFELPDTARQAGLAMSRTGDTRRLIARAAAVVTVNSTAGLEAVALGVPVVVVGDAQYALAGVVQNPPALSGLPQALVRALEVPADEGLRRALLDYLRFEYQHEVNPRRPQTSPGLERMVDTVAAARRVRG